MKTKLIPLLFIVITFYAKAQKPTATYNHIAYFVHNVDSSVAFYKNVFAVDTIRCPFPPMKTRRTKWVKVADNIELHLSQNIPDSIPFNNQFHLGFTVVSINDFIKRLMKQSRDYRTGKYIEPTIDRMPSGAKTILIRDPDGNRIHLIEAKQN